MSTGRKCRHCWIWSILNMEGSPTVIIKCGHCGYIKEEVYKKPSDDDRRRIKSALDSYHRIHEGPGCPNWRTKEYA